MGFPGGAVVKNLPAMQETQELRQPLGWEDLLQKGVEAHFSILVWTIPSTEEPSGLQFTGLQSQAQLGEHEHPSSLPRCF